MKRVGEVGCDRGSEDLLPRTEPLLINCDECSFERFCDELSPGEADADSLKRTEAEFGREDEECVRERK